MARMTPPGGDDQARALELLARLEPVLVRFEDIVRRAGVDRVMTALDRLDGYLNNPAARFMAATKGRRQ